MTNFCCLCFTNMACGLPLHFVLKNIFKIFFIFFIILLLFPLPWPLGRSWDGVIHSKCHGFIRTKNGCACSELWLNSSRGKNIIMMMMTTMTMTTMIMYRLSLILGLGLECYNNRFIVFIVCRRLSIVFQGLPKSNNRCLYYGLLNTIHTYVWAWLHSITLDLVAMIEPIWKKK